MSNKPIDICNDGNWYIDYHDGGLDDFVLRVVLGNGRVEFGSAFTSDVTSRTAVEQVFKALHERMLEVERRLKARTTEQNDG